MQYHNPVLLQDCIDGLNIKPDGVYVDVTFGGGGHSREILKHLTTGKLIAFDQDADAIENKPDNANLILINQNFRYLKNYLRLHQITQIDGLLADLGVSSHQFDVAERGFSIRFDADLDMRMNKNATLTAKQILNTYEEAKLVILFKEYGEVINAKFLVKLICEYRSQQSINTVDQFKLLIKRATPRQKENQFLAQVFQALRIEVNDELQVLKEMLEQAVDLLKPGGRLVVMSYHSLEDKLVKNYIKQGKFFGEAEKDFFGNVTVPLKQITRKPIVPADIEVLTNSRARSAKLRIAEKNIMAKNSFKEIKSEEPIINEAVVTEEVKSRAKASDNKITKSVADVFSGNFLTRDNTVKQLPFIIFLCVMAMGYIANSYYAERTVREINKVTNEIKELRSEYITTKSDLMYLSKQSEVARAVHEIGLKESVVPPKKIVIETKIDTVKNK